MNSNLIRILFLALAGPLASGSAAERFPFVIPGFDFTATATDMSGLNHKPAGRHGFVRVQNGHFATDAGRLHIWGVNLSFGANFPTHEEADKAAAHLAKLGINGVRIHHHETVESPRGLFRKDGEWDPQQVDRLDYLLARLHEHGIYANLNLHVGRNLSRQLGLPNLGSEHYLMRDKPALHFYPPIQNAFWKFCREYLAHVNPYRGLRRADDPGIAMLEIANENRFSLAGAEPFLRAPEPFRSELRRRWNDWLAANFTDTDALRAAWTMEKETEPRTLASHVDWQKPGLGRWHLNDNNGKAPIDLQRHDDGKTLRFEPRVRATQGWHQQFSAGGLSLEAGVTYLLRFRLRSDRPRPVSLHVATTKFGKWESLGLSKRLDATTQWVAHEFRFIPTKAVTEGANLSFDIGGDDTPLEISSIVLSSGGNWSTVPDGQSLEKRDIDLPNASSSPKANKAFQRFLHDTEREFYQRTKALLVQEIGIQVPITTTQINYHPASIADEIGDYADMHAYWHHPTFPGRQWDPNNWNVENETLVAYPFHNQWPRVNMTMRAPWRLRGKPFTFSEWNTGEPGFFSADAIPIAALTASLQDWDAVFFFNYKGGGGNWDSDAIGGYFDLNGQPTKIALVTALANLYRRNDLPALPHLALIADGEQERMGALALTHLLATDPKLAAEKSHPAPTEAELEQAANKLVRSPDGAVTWDARDPQRAHVLIETPRTIVVWGLVANREFQLGPFEFRIGACERDYAVITATSLDGQPLKDSRRILITAVGNAENQDMGWNAERTSVGSNWGHGPTIANGIPIQLKTETEFRCHALDGSGSRRQELTRIADAFHLSPDSRTLWYELSR